MTFLRRVALRISAFVARHASPAWQEWAAGMASEAAYIKSDWAALGWALGSTRILLDRRKAPKQRAPLNLFTLAEVPREAKAFVEKARSGGQSLSFLILLVGVFTNHSAKSPGLYAAGFAIASLGVAASCALWLVERRRLKDPARHPICDDPKQCAQVYRSELERYRITMWIPDFTSCSLVAAINVRDWHVLTEAPWIFGLQALMLVFMMTYADHRRWMNQRRIDQLDALLAGTA